MVLRMTWLSPGVCSDPCPLSQWCHPTSVTLFSFCPQSFQASGSFPVSWLFASGCQSIRVSASASVLPVGSQSWFPLGLTGLILESTGPSRVFSSTTVGKHRHVLWLSAFFMFQLSRPYTTTRKVISSDFWLDGPLSAKWCLCYLICCLGLS